jgi:hypothetical protein
MRHKSSITSLPWIPSEAVEGSMRISKGHRREGTRRGRAAAARK